MLDDLKLAMLQNSEAKLLYDLRCVLEERNELLAELQRTRYYLACMMAALLVALVLAVILSAS